MTKDFKSMFSPGEFLLANNAIILMVLMGAVLLSSLIYIPVAKKEFVANVQNKEFYPSQGARDASEFSLANYEALAQEIAEPTAVAGEMSRDIFAEKLADFVRAAMKYCPDCGREIPKNAATCPYCGAPQYDVDTDMDEMPDAWELLFAFDVNDANDALDDPDQDGYSNVEEYKAGSDPKNPKVTPESMALVARYNVERIYRKPVDLLFKGYIHLPDGGYNFQINWGDGTDFIDMNAKIRGYLIVDFVKKIIENPRSDGTVGTMDLSTLTLRKGNDTPIVLQIGRVTIAKELYADIRDSKGGNRVTVYVGSKLHEYKVLDITRGEVIISDNEGNEFRLTRQRR